MASFSLHCKLTDLYKLNYKNEWLIKEQKKLIELFPEGVLIQNKSALKAKPTYLSNEVFYRDILNSENILGQYNTQIEELKNIKVKIKRENLQMNETEEILMNLDQMLVNQEHKLQEEAQVEQLNIIIEHQDQNYEIEELARADGAQNNNIFRRYYCVKTMKINWNSNSSYLHVFIDNTNIMKLEEANNSIHWQKIMFASASHEFRTPLNAILNSYNLIELTFQSMYDSLFSLKHSPEEAKEIVDKNFTLVKKYVQMGSCSSILLLSLIEDILNLSKIDNGTFVINKVDFYVKELITEVYDIFHYQCSHKKLDLKIVVDKKFDIWLINSDRSRLKQVLLNLLSNSLKFTFKGSITIEVSYYPSFPQSYAKFAVKDTGLGIKKHDQSKLFKLFGMIKSSRDSTSGNRVNVNPNGWGLGLTISKKYIEYLGGTIELKSTYNIGTIVTFRIPIDLDQIENYNRNNSREENNFGSNELFESIESIEPIEYNVRGWREFTANKSRFACV